MTAKPVVARLQAHQDVGAAISYYLQENAADAALGFINALEQAYRHIGLRGAVQRLGRGRRWRAFLPQTVRAWIVQHSLTPILSGRRAASAPPACTSRALFSGKAAS